MSTKNGIVDDTIARHKQRSGLSAEEVFQLMAAYTADKTCITEEDALTLCAWAQAQKFGAYVLELVLAGSLRVTVEGHEVKVGLRR